MRSLLAAFMLFTRLPLWRVVEIDKKYYNNALYYWGLTGIFTGFITWGVLHVCAEVLPLLPACVAAIAARLILTGALHEDGLADFFDGFGGGHDKESILRIMKDSHIGSYGTIGLIVYFLLYTSFLYSLPTDNHMAIIIGADVLSKTCTAIMISTLTYARTEATSKVKVLYKRIEMLQFLPIIVTIGLILWYISTPLWGLIPSIAVCIALRFYLKYKINGYTGDCCGAGFLLTEQAFYAGTLISLQL